MVIGLIIYSKYRIVEIEYTSIQDLRRFIPNFTYYRLSEIHEIEDGNSEYQLYMNLFGYNHNTFEFHQYSPVGPVVVLKKNMIGFPIDIDMDSFLSYYECICDDYLVGMMGVNYIGDYDYDGDFIMY